MKIRLVSRGDGKYQVYGEVQSGKGKAVTTGKIVSQEELSQEVGRILDVARNSAAENPA